MGGAELQHFLCSSPIQELFFPHESDILLPAFLSLILTPTFSSNVVLSLTTAHRPPTHRCPTIPGAAKPGLSRGIWRWEGFRPCWATPGCWALPGKARGIFSCIQTLHILPHRTFTPHFHPRTGTARSHPLFWQYLFSSMSSRYWIHHCSNPQLWSGFKISQGAFLRPLVSKLPGICHTNVFLPFICFFQVIRGGIVCYLSYLGLSHLGTKWEKEKKGKKRDLQWIKTADCSNKRRYFNDRFKTC